MSFLSEIGYAGEAPENVETRAAAGGLLPAGFYVARLDGAKPRTANSGSDGTEFTFTVAEGPFAGATVTDTVWNPNPEKPQAAARLNDRRMLFASRLGLIRKSADGKKYEDVPGKTGWVDCLDAVVIVEVQHEKYKRDDGTEGVSARLAFGGIHDKHDPKARAALGKPPAAGGSANGKPPAGPAPTPAPKPNTPPADPTAARRRAVANL